MYKSPLELSTQLTKGFTPVSNGFRRSRANSASEFMESPGKKYPRLCVLLSALSLFCFISWLPFLSEKPRGPIAFVWPSNQSRNARHLIFPEEKTSLLSSPVCGGSSPPYLLVIVCSALQNFEARYTIRKSWAEVQHSLNNVKVVFLVGQRLNETLQDKLKSESEEYGDIIQESFVDSYANLSVKSLMLLKWFNHNCDNTQYLLKTDDDMYINLNKLYQIAQENKKPNLLLGSLICNAIPIKDPYNKWYVPSYMFSGKRYPNYLSGTAYLMQRSTAIKLYQASLDTPIFHLEDIYITGILSSKVKIRPSDNIGFSYIRRKLNSCLFKQTVSTHNVKLTEMKAIYEKLQSSNNQECPTIRARLLREYGPGKCSWPKN